MTGASVPDRALAVPATPASGRDASRFDPSRKALEIGEQFLNACYSAWSCGEPEHRVRTMLDRADEFRAALNALEQPQPYRPIMLEMAAADDAHRKWHRRWLSLIQIYAIENCFVDVDGKWGLRGFLDYAGAACGFDRKGIR